MKRQLKKIVPVLLLASACASNTQDQSPGTTASANPFFEPSSLYMSFPEFDKIKNEHYGPAMERGMQEQLVEMDAIANNKEAATFENTMVALEKSGQILDRSTRVFFALASADTNDDINALRQDMAPKLAAHSDAILLNADLFGRIKALYDQRDELNLSAEENRLLVENYKDFVRSGAMLSEADKETLRAINAELATLQAQFSQNVLEEVNSKAIVVDSAEELAGLSDSQISAAQEAAKARDMDGKYVLPLLNTSGQPSMASLQNRALRERIHRVSLGRGSSGGDYDNTAVLVKVAKLRAQQAKLMGFDNHAAYRLQSQTAQTTAAVNERLATLAPAAVANARNEAKALQAMMDAEIKGSTLSSWDWDYYTEKVRAERYNFDAAQLKPYLEMNNVLQNGVFYAAEKVFGLTFKERTDLPVYNPDVKVWEVFNEDGTTLALFIQDFYARESKRGGAWMNAYVSQSGLMGTKPVVANHLNIPKPPAGEPTLLTWDEVTTMFHEFGHALHGMFSNVTYPSFSGTSVPRDFVEYPSQVNEMWADWPEVLKNYAVHYQNGEAMPKELLDKVFASAKFNQGFGTTEYLAASLLDQAWHQLDVDDVPTAENVLAFEAAALKKAGVSMDAVPPRYRSTYFSHIMGGYSAGYYAYIWSEVLDADSVVWFKENGGMLRKNGDHFRDSLLSRGGAEDAMTLFKNFRGSDPDIKPLLDRKGLNAK